MCVCVCKGREGVCGGGDSVLCSRSLTITLLLIDNHWHLIRRSSNKESIFVFCIRRPSVVAELYIH